MESGLNQGDALTSDLFNIALMPLVCAVKRRLEGIKLHQSSLKAIVYVDDALWIVGP